jgi:hypothetical protein
MPMIARKKPAKKRRTQRGAIKKPQKKKVQKRQTLSKGPQVWRDIKDKKIPKWARKEVRGLMKALGPPNSDSEEDDDLPPWNLDDPASTDGDGWDDE